MHSSKAIRFSLLWEFFSTAIATCSWNVTCPCGPSAIYYTFCLNDVPRTADPCVTWANCETCRSDLNECLTCAQGSYGQSCEFNITDTRAFRQKRQYRHFYPVQFNHHQATSGSNRVCGDLKSPKSGSVSCWISSGGQRECTGVCVPGYVFNGRESETEIVLNCDRGFWTPASTFPDCKSGGHCELEVIGGQYNCTTNMTGAYCDVRCDSPPIKNRRYFCYPGSGWTPPLPHCVNEIAGPITSPARTGGASACKCLNGGTCDADGTCVCPPNFAGRFCDSENSVACRDPGQVANADRFNVATGQSSSSQSYQVGESVLYNCHSGFTRRGESQLTCLSSGLWSNRLPICRRSSAPQVSPQRPGTTSTTPNIEFLTFCPDPGTDTNGERILAGGSTDGISQTGFAQGTELVYSCKNGYRLQGQNSLSCLPQGLWSSVRPSCQLSPGSQSSEEEYFDEDDDDVVAYCDSPGPISNGQYRVVAVADQRDQDNPQSGQPTRYRETTRLLFICNEGYALVGSPTLHCQQDGTWSQDTPHCTTDCGRSRIQTSQRMHRGVTTVPGEWPWTVAIANISGGFTRLSCGGTLVDTRTVLTAAHCLMDPVLERTSNIRLYFGKFYRDDARDDNEVESRTPTSFIINRQYDTVTMDNDIALIRFYPPIKYTDRILSVCLPTTRTSEANLRPGNRGYVLGWGMTERNLPSDELLMALIPIVPGPDCKTAFESQNLMMPITDNMFCAGFPEGKSGSCTGDSGGPIVFYDRETDRHSIEGIVSFGIRGECGRPQRYTVFTQVSRYMDWIKRTLRRP